MHPIIHVSNISVFEFSPYLDPHIYVNALSLNEIYKKKKNFLL